MRVVRFLLLSVLGVAALVLSAFSPWIADLSGTSIPVRDVFGITGDTASFVVSIGFVMLVVAAAGLVATLIVSRMVQVVAGAVGLVITVAWIVQSMLDDVALGDIGVGAWMALGGSAALLLASYLGRAPRSKPRSKKAGSPPAR